MATSHQPALRDEGVLQSERRPSRHRYRLRLHAEPNVPSLLQQCAAHGLTVDLLQTSYYLGRETLLPTGRSKMWRWRKSLFAYISRKARPATAYFGLPPSRVVELGMQLDF